MAENSTLPATGDVIAADDIVGVKYQRVKISAGTDGEAVDVGMGAGIPARSDCLTVTQSVTAEGDTTIIDMDVGGYRSLSFGVFGVVDGSDCGVVFGMASDGVHYGSAKLVVESGGDPVVDGIYGMSGAGYGPLDYRWIRVTVFNNTGSVLATPIDVTVTFNAAPISLLGHKAMSTPTSLIDYVNPGTIASQGGLPRQPSGGMLITAAVQYVCNGDNMIVPRVPKYWASNSANAAGDTPLFTSLGTTALVRYMIEVTANASIAVAGMMTVGIHNGAGPGLAIEHALYLPGTEDTTRGGVCYSTGMLELGTVLDVGDPVEMNDYVITLSEALVTGAAIVRIGVTNQEPPED